ncbi:DUF4296 domain-containing protein [Seonamhaeicola marinus]|uniref:DUF4296 domain-containing protein n=1 Tax=Seonamhaeicola marinus TaxID=1912246 RepID=A0A5D0HGH8_9FLAO|nr:DUF4296 domain-containing protein [Seonamhaeicola marinus]TYA70040.1 DUF4296 domain-containing protein [Seonamhaeicola marinus]
MLKRFFIIFIALLVVMACDGSKKPKNLISKKRMVNILIDAKLIAGANSVNRKIMEKNNIFPNSYIFKKHNIDSLQFAESNTYYAYNVKEYEEIYQMVKDSLDELKESLKNLQDREREEAAKKSRDSLDVILKKRDSLKFSGPINDSLALMKIEEELVKQELEEIDIDEEINLIEPVSDN